MSTRETRKKLSLSIVSSPEILLMMVMTVVMMWMVAVMVVMGISMIS